MLECSRRRTIFMCSKLTPSQQGGCKCRLVSRSENNSENLAILFHSWIFSILVIKSISPFLTHVEHTCSPSGEWQVQVLFSHCLQFKSRITRWDVVFSILSKYGSLWSIILLHLKHTCFSTSHIQWLNKDAMVAQWLLSEHFLFGKGCKWRDTADMGLIAILKSY